MSLDHRLLEAIDLAYRAALEPELWPEALQRAAECTGSRSAVLLHSLPGRPWGGMGSSRLDPAVPDAYFQDYKAINPIQEQIDRYKPHSTRTVRTDQSYVDKADLVASDFYDRFLRPTQMHAFLMLPLAQTNSTLNIVRDPREEEFGAAEIEVGAAIMRSLDSAFAMSVRLDAQRRVRGELADFVDRQSGALFVVAADGAIVFANSAAEALLEQRDGLTAPARLLRAASQDAQAGLMRLIGAAASPVAEQRRGGAIPLPRPSGRRSLSVLVTPARGGVALTVPSGPLALVSVVDPAAALAAPADQLRALFGFTAAEARVAAEFAAGRDPRTIAERLGLSVSTVRVHILRIREKTETSRQGEFIALVLRSLGGPAWPLGA